MKSQDQGLQLLSIELSSQIQTEQQRLLLLTMTTTEQSFESVLVSITKLRDHNSFMEYLRRQDQTESHGLELFRFLYIKAFSAQVSPSLAVDRTWCSLLHFSLLYKQICKLLLACKDTVEYEEGIIPHDPLEGDNQYARNKRYANALEKYAVHFPGGPVQKDVWPEKYEDGEELPHTFLGKRARHEEDPNHFLQPILTPPSIAKTTDPIIRLRVRNADGSERHYNIRRTTPMKVLFEAHASHLKVSVEYARFWFDDRILGVNDTVDSMRMEDGDQVDCIPVLMGGI